MNVRFNCTLLLFFISFTLCSQMTSKVANEYFQMGNYETSLPAYERLLKQDTTNAEYTYRLGVCYLMLTTDRKKAVPYLEKASTMKGVPSYVWLDLGSAYRYSNQLDKAREALEKYLPIARNGEEKEIANLLLQQIENAKVLMANPVNVDFVNLGTNINSNFDDFSPFVDKNNRWMLFNSKRIFNKVDELYVVNVHNADYKRNEWKKAGRSKSVNSAEDNFVVGKSANDDFIFIKPQRYEIFDDILMVDMTNGSIGAKVIPLPEPINTKDEESGATLSVSGDTLIFASNPGMDLAG